MREKVPSSSQTDTPKFTAEIRNFSKTQMGQNYESKGTNKSKGFKYSPAKKVDLNISISSHRSEVDKFIDILMNQDDRPDLNSVGSPNIKPDV